MNPASFFRCPECDLEMEITEDILGQEVECPECDASFTLPLAFATERTLPRNLSQVPPPSPSSQPEKGKIVMSRSNVNEIKEQAARVREKSDLAHEQGDFFAPEKKAMGSGMLGGLAMMGIAVVWFVLGYALGYIFFYPPILFVLGLFAFFKGMFR
ncbi:MAG: hypothetical protein JJU29_18540 [Verrucomicrobia bacterium]|nr:hypothetical protein [Verrucomicrobiota bacterium]MCH8512405.1 hypothetical protein [Kiritimatiellia bacterium]